MQIQMTKWLSIVAGSAANYRMEINLVICFAGAVALIQSALRGLKPARIALK